MFRSIMFLILALSGLSASLPALGQADALTVTMFLVPERSICGGKHPFSGCPRINNRNFDTFKRKLFGADSHPITFAIPPETVDLTVDPHRQSDLMSLIAYAGRYRDKQGATEMTAAVFLLDLPKGVGKLVSFRRNNDQGSADIFSVAYTRGRYVTWINAVDVDPGAHASFDLEVGADKRSFLFVGQ